MKRILYTIAILSALTSCKKGDEPTPEPTPVAPAAVTYTWSHYMISGAGSNLAIHFGDSLSATVTPFIGRNEIKVNGVVFNSFTADTTTNAGTNYYTGNAFGVLHSGDTIDIKNMVAPYWKRIYRNGVLMVNDSSANSARYILP